MYRCSSPASGHGAASQSVSANGLRRLDVTVYELFCGLAKAQDPARERQKLDLFISAVIELPLDRASAEAAAKVRSELESQGNLIGPYDLLIAGQALAGGLTLVTNNVREFQRVRGLNLQSGP